MNRSDSPSKQPTPFGINGPREPILSTTPAGDNTASYNSGFPPITMTLKSSGGLPPKGQDMNQILYELSSLCRWASSGALNSFDQAFCTAIAGYPKGSLLLGDDGVTRYISTIDANTNNPNSSSTGWFNLSTAYQPKDAMLTSLASLNTVNLQFPVFNGPKSIGLGALTNLSLDFLSKSTSADMLSLLSAAPVNSPTFTGDPKAPTPAAGDNDTSIATTAFVKTAIGNLQGKQKFPGVGSFTVPTGVSLIYLSGCAGGGGGGAGGGGGNNGAFGAGGGGGGAGQSIFREPYAVTPGQVINITIGAGGAAGVPASATTGGNGGAGGNTVIGSLVTLNGGVGGSGGLSSGSVAPGGNPGSGYPYGGFGGDGSLNVATAYGGSGGSCPFGGGGNSGRAATTDGVGATAASGYGAGGAGGGGHYGNVSPLYAGGAGSAGMPGVVFIEW